MLVFALKTQERKKKDKDTSGSDSYLEGWGEECRNGFKTSLGISSFIAC